jgi:hypothetical protein
VANEPLERLKELRQKPFYEIHSWQLNWASYPERQKIADRMLWLRNTKHDKPIHKAFDFFPDLDRRDPRHWRILMTYLAEALFPSAKEGARAATISKNKELLARCDALPEKYKSDPTTMLKQLMKKYPTDYGAGTSDQTSSAYKNKLRGLRRRLNAAREHREYETKMFGPARTD